MGQHSPKDPVAHLRGPGALKPRGPGGPSPPWTWGPEHLPGDFLAGWPSSICVGSSADGSTHPHKASCSVLLPSGVIRCSHGLAPAAGGFCPAHPGRAGPGSQPGLEQLGSPSLQHRAATSLGRTIGVSGPAGSTQGRQLQVPGKSSLLLHHPSSISRGNLVADAVPAAVLRRGEWPRPVWPWSLGLWGGDRDSSRDDAGSSGQAGSAACSRWGWGRPGWERCPAGCAAPGIWALNHTRGEMQKGGEKR